jgi:uncharacterized protein (DUF427 family)
MPKKVSRNLSLIAIGIFIVAGILMGVGFAGSTTSYDPTTNTTYVTSVAHPALVVIAYLFFLAGFILAFIAYIGALIKTATLGRWGWFVCLLLIQPTILVYIFAGPETPAGGQMPMGYAPQAYPPQQVFAHARDPYKRVDVLPSSRHVRIVLGGVTIADTRRPQLLLETGLPIRYYIPEQDVRMELLETSETTTRCPYKGEASYWSARIGERVFKDIVWSYHEPLPACSPIAGLLCFFNERVDAIYVDGELIPQQGYPPQGYGQPGYPPPPQGYPQPGYPPQGYPQSDNPQQGGYPPVDYPRQ